MFDAEEWPGLEKKYLKQFKTNSYEASKRIFWCFVLHYCTDRFGLQKGTLTSLDHVQSLFRFKICGQYTFLMVRPIGLRSFYMHTLDLWLNFD